MVNNKKKIAELKARLEKNVFLKPMDEVIKSMSIKFLEEFEDEETIEYYHGMIIDELKIKSKLESKYYLYNFFQEMIQKERIKKGLDHYVSKTVEAKKTEITEEVKEEPKVIPEVCEPHFKPEIVEPESVSEIIEEECAAITEESEIDIQEENEEEVQEQDEVPFIEKENLEPEVSEYTNEEEEETKIVIKEKIFINDGNEEENNYEDRPVVKKTFDTDDFFN